MKLTAEKTEEDLKKEKEVVSEMMEVKSGLVSDLEEKKEIVKANEEKLVVAEEKIQVADLKTKELEE